MTNHTPDHLTNPLTADSEKLTRICAEVCYGWRLERQSNGSVIYRPKTLDESCIDSKDFQPLAKTEKGRSQAFELAVKFDCFPGKLIGGTNRVYLLWANQWVSHDNPQAAIVIASILTAQQENNDE